MDFLYDDCCVNSVPCENYSVCSANKLKVNGNTGILQPVLPDMPPDMSDCSVMLPIERHAEKAFFSERAFVN